MDIRNLFYAIYLSVQNNRLIVAQAVIAVLGLALVAKPLFPEWAARVFDKSSVVFGATLVASAPLISAILTSPASLPALSTAMFALIVNAVNIALAMIVTASIAVIGLAILAKPLFPRWAAQNQALIGDIVLGCIIMSAVDQIATLIVPL